MLVKINKVILLTLFAGSVQLSAQKIYHLQSPDRKLQATIEVGGESITYWMMHEQDTVLYPSRLSMTINDGRVWGKNTRVKRADYRDVNTIVEAPFYKRKQIKNCYRELQLECKGDYLVLFRIYNEGIAYRFVSEYTSSFQVIEEEATFNFGVDRQAYVPYSNRGEENDIESQLFNSFESRYVHAPLSSWSKGRIAFSPLLVEVGRKKVCIAEADVENYPGLFLQNVDASPVLTGYSARYPVEEEQGGYNQLQGIVKKRGGYIAHCFGKRNFPWRTVIVAASDMELADNDMIYRLATPSRLPDISWIKPGKVAWEWWSNWNLYGVDFCSGINDDTYKYFIDFAARNKIPYVLLDEGWSVTGKADLMQVIPDLDLKMLADYAQSKGVGLILWAGYYAFNRDMENVCRHYAAMGIKGFKIDFMDRDDQKMVEFYYKSAEMAAKYHLLVDFHGAYKPTGLQRTYPNALNFEGVYGLEQMKWADGSIDQVTYDVTIPFIRMLAGPMDYTQGAMRNAVQKNYRQVYDEAMSQGTRCRQLAEYVIFESPLNMLCDSPSNYEREQECTDFISAVPSVWDETKVLNGEVGCYVTIARRNGDEWYIGALTDWNHREFMLDLSFLDEGDYRAEIYRDGMNADKVGMDYKREIIYISADRQLPVKMVPGGGFVARIFKD